MKNTKQLSGTVAALMGLLTQPALAQEVTVGASASTDKSPRTEASADAEPVSAPDASPISEPPHTPYMKRYVPEPLMWEMGMFGGAMFPSKNHKLFDAQRPSSVRSEYEIAGDVGIRFAFFPATFFGVEAEGAVMPTKAKDGNTASLYAVRAHGILQIPGASITPFALAGGGGLGASSTLMGEDLDPAFHFGGGVKFALDEHLLIRIEGRDTMTRAWEDTGRSRAHSPEVLIGLSFVPDRTKPDHDGDGFLDYRDECPSIAGDRRGCPPPDSDRDGIIDDSDECPDVAGIGPTGCPDTDGDGLLDRDDPCPEAAGELPGGCPEKVCPILDADGDGLLDEVDQCPNEAARTLTGCIVHDKDNDGIPDDRDKCVDEQETRNGFEDTDGCPDEIPEKVRKFTGVIRGIEFDLGSAKIKKQSERLLGEAAGVLKGYPELRVQITGHSDDQGERETNMKLSQERADSVKAFLVQLGVADTQIETKGMGPDRPLTENDTAAGRQKNRRIEFAIIND